MQQGRIIRRSVPSADQVSALTYNIAFLELKDESDARSRIQNTILKQLEAASSMELGEFREFSYASPLRPAHGRES